MEKERMTNDNKAARTTKERQLLIAQLRVEQKQARDAGNTTLASKLALQIRRLQN